ncbi:hypothetical protein J3F84DRAFT_381060 [Trichoderma pleuroticola]
MPRVPLCTPPARFVNEAVQFSNPPRISAALPILPLLFMVVPMAHRACDCHFFFSILWLSLPAFATTVGIDNSWAQISSSGLRC